MNLDITSDWVLLLLRLVLGLTFIYYGWPKIKDLKANAKDFEKKGFYPGVLWGSLIVGLEFFGGIAVVSGIYAEFFALALMFHMATGTFWKLKMKMPFTNYSYDIQLFTLAAAVAFFGAGTFSINNFNALPLLRWDLAIGVFAMSAVFAYFSKPQKDKTDK